MAGASDRARGQEAVYLPDAPKKTASYWLLTQLTNIAGFFTA
ncbi:hypothetical protein ACWD1Y_33480 [Streptomyces sp. NPDC002814]